MFYKNSNVKDLRQGLCKGDSPEQVNRCMKVIFKINLLSSNNHDCLRKKKGYIICKNNVQPDAYSLIPANAQDATETMIKTELNKNVQQICENSTLYVPKTLENLTQVMRTIQLDHLEQPVRIWTDYERFNATHFWSNSAQNWWRTFGKQGDINGLGQFKDSTIFNGNGKIMNFSPAHRGSCVCVTNLRIKTHFICLILCLIFSFVFVIGSIIYRKM